MSKMAYAKVTEDERTALREEIAHWCRRWRGGQMAWSFAHHISLFGATVVSITTGFILQLDQDLFGHLSNKTVSTLLALGAAVLSGMAAVGGFERKWRANRLSRGRLDELRIDFMDERHDLGNARKRLKAMIRLHDQEILGGASSLPPADPGSVLKPAEDANG
jgi:hypothetical protein